MFPSTPSHLTITLSSSSTFHVSLTTKQGSSATSTFTNRRSALGRELRSFDQPEGYTHRAGRPSLRASTHLRDSGGPLKILLRTTSHVDGTALCVQASGCGQAGGDDGGFAGESDSSGGGGGRGIGDSRMNGSRCVAGVTFRNRNEQEFSGGRGVCAKADLTSGMDWSRIRSSVTDSRCLELCFVASLPGTWAGIRIPSDEQTSLDQNV